MSRPTYVIAASVPEGNRVRRFHGTGSDSASYLLMNVPQFRWGSFDVAIPDEVRPGPEESLELGSGDRKLLRLYQDGTVVFRAAADYEFLGWGVEPEQFERFPRINPVAAVEVHASFAHFYRMVIGRLQWKPQSVMVKLRLTGGAQNEHRIFLTPYYEHGIERVVRPKRYEVQSDPAEETLTVPLAAWTETPNRAGFLLMAAFASMFDMPEEEIPFAAEGKEGREVDMEEIKGL